MSGPAPTTMWMSWKSDQNCDQYRNFLYIYKYINIAEFLIRDLQNEKPDHPHLPLLKSRVSEQSLFRSKILLKKWCFRKKSRKGVSSKDTTKM